MLLDDVVLADKSYTSLRCELTDGGVLLLVKRLSSSACKRAA